MSKGSTRKVKCRFLPTQDTTEDTISFVSMKVDMYVVSDLAFYGMVLGREHIMEDWCYLCRLRHVAFQNLLRQGKAWTWAKMEEFANDVADPKYKQASKLGVKEAPWWTFIPLDHFFATSPTYPHWSLE